MVMASSLKLVPFLLLLASPVLAQTYNVGHAASPAELAMDITISPTGANLPVGSGTSKVGAMLFVDKGCSSCHGDAGKGGVTSAPALLSAKANKPWGPDNSPWDSGINIPVVEHATGRVAIPDVRGRSEAEASAILRAAQWPYLK